MKLLPFSSWREVRFIALHPYLLFRKGLSAARMNPNPFQQFSNWYNQAEKYPFLEFPNGMCLSTLRDDGYPDGRMVLLKDYSDQGFVFYTNSLSSKGHALAKHQKVSATFYWGPLQRQVRVRGSARKVDDRLADEYFASRPRISQLGAWASEQSKKLASREELEQRYADFEKKYPSDVPRPEHWTGYVIEPQEIEFWQLRLGRLHDRFLYEKDDAGEWSFSRLAP